MLVNIGKGIELEVDANGLPPVAIEHVIKIGLRNVLMDVHAGVTAEAFPDEAARVAESRSRAERKLAALMAGEVRTVGTRGPRAVDAVAKEINRIALADVEAAVRRAGKKPKDVDMKALVAAHREKNADSLRARAEAAVAEAEKNAEDLGIEI